MYDEILDQQVDIMLLVITFLTHPRGNAFPFYIQTARQKMSNYQQRDYEKIYSSLLIGLPLR